MQVAYQQTAIRPEMQVTVIPATIPQKRSILKQKLLRVAAYCRVSTDHEDQQNSYQTQIDYYTQKITGTPNWKLVKIFADEGITATSTAKRKDFLAMVEWCKAGKIDCIITKSLSRFARNTVDAIQYVRLLKRLGVAVIFEKENINTAELNSEFILQIYAMIAQSESESISNNVKDGRRKGYSLGKVPMMYGQLLGYQKGADGQAEIVSHEAEIIIDIFTKFLDGWSIRVICDSLEAQNIPTKNGKYKWSQGVVRHILTNEKYKGDVLVQKTYLKDLFTKKAVKNNGELPQYLVKKPSHSHH